jgi:hypothetical protein
MTPLAVLVLVSSQTGFSRHFRYAYPCLPFAYVWVSQVCGTGVKHRQWRAMSAACLVWYVASSVAVWPLGHSYFNELAGGPRGGPTVLLDSNLDWGEDVTYAYRWLLAHPEARPVYRVFVTDEFAHHLSGRWHPAPSKLRPGWYLASLHRVLDPDDPFHVLNQFLAKQRIGFSLFVYRVTVRDVAAVESAEQRSRHRKAGPASSSGDAVQNAQLAVEMIHEGLVIERAARGTR